MRIRSGIDLTTIGWRSSVGESSQGIDRLQQQARTRAEEPPFKHLEGLSAAKNLRQTGVHRQSEGPVTARQHDRVLLDRQIVRKENKRFRLFDLGAGEQQLVTGETVHPSGFQSDGAFIAVLHQHEGHIELLPAQQVRHSALIARAGDDCELLSNHLGQCVDVRGTCHQDAGGFDEDENGKIDLLHATERDGTGAALKIGLACGDGVKSGIDGHRDPFDLQVLQPELLRNRLRDLATKIDRIAEGSFASLTKENGRASPRWACVSSCWR